MLLHRDTNEGLDKVSSGAPPVPPPRRPHTDPTPPPHRPRAAWPSLRRSSAASPPQRRRPHAAAAPPPRRANTPARHSHTAPTTPRHAAPTPPSRRRNAASTPLHAARTPTSRRSRTASRRPHAAHAASARGLRAALRLGIGAGGAALGRRFWEPLHKHTGAEVVHDTSITSRVRILAVVGAAGRLSAGDFGGTGGRTGGFLWRAGRGSSPGGVAGRVGLRGEGVVGCVGPGGGGGVEAGRVGQGVLRGWQARLRMGRPGWVGRRWAGW